MLIVYDDKIKNRNKQKNYFQNHKLIDLLIKNDSERKPENDLNFNEFENQFEIE